MTNTVARKSLCDADHQPSAQDAAPDVSTCGTSQEQLMDYIAFQIPDWFLSDHSKCICILRGCLNQTAGDGKEYTTFEALLLSPSKDFKCMDLSLYKEHQIVLLLNEVTAASDGSENALLMIIQASDLPFVSMSKSTRQNLWQLDQLKDSVLPLQMETAKVRSIAHNVNAPLAVSSSRGVACVFATRRRALVYILEEDEDDDEASDMD